MQNNYSDTPTAHSPSPMYTSPTPGISLTTNNGQTFITTESYTVWLERSDWECELFGTGVALVLRPATGKVPNWFWRQMQYLCFGNKWKKVNDSNKNS